jgi:hypothetical protein
MKADESPVQINIDHFFKPALLRSKRSSTSKSSVDEKKMLSCYSF